MATIRREMIVSRASDAVWDAVRDVGAVHTRLAPAFVTNVTLAPGARMVTFANGMVVRELLIDCDDTEHRLVWSARSERLSHHNASLQVFADAPAGQARVVWTCDMLPDALKDTIAGMIEAGMAAMKNHLEADMPRAAHTAVQGDRC